MSELEAVPGATGAVREEQNLRARLYSINHVFLPPELPQEDDSSEFCELLLTEDVRIALQGFRALLADQPGVEPLDRCSDLVQRMQRIRGEHGHLAGEVLDTEMEKLGHGKIIAIHVRAQNAGLLITRVGEEYQFRLFELLARDQDVMAHRGRLRRRFPGPALSIDAKHVRDPRFRKAIVDLLLVLDQETDGGGIAEEAVDQDPGNIADTTDPRLVIGMLAGVLRGIGRPCAVSAIRKWSREEVFLKDDAHRPWRRSALWLMIRVALQLTLPNPAPGEISLYKEFMIYFMSHLLSESPPLRLPHDLLFFMTTKISRRILKLGSTPTGPGFATERPGVAFARGKLGLMSRTLEREWEQVQSKVKPLKPPRLASLDFDKDSQLKLPELRRYLDEINQEPTDCGQPEAEVSAGRPFQRNGRQDGRLEFFPRSDITTDREFAFFELADFEQSVDEFLGSYWSSLDGGGEPLRKANGEEDA